METSHETRENEISTLLEVYSDICIKQTDDILIFNINDEEMNNEKIRFEVRFNKSYPETNAPDFILNADWMCKNYVEEIRKSLEIAWSKNMNQPVVFLWVELIKDKLRNFNDKLKKDKSVKLKTEEQSKDVTTRFEKEFIFYVGGLIQDRKSTFQAFLTRINCAEDIELAKDQLLLKYKRVQDATHNIMAYRLVLNNGDKKKIDFGYDDDGETQAGSRLSLLLEYTDCQNVLVIVSRWFGGTKLGPDRFKHINNAARNVLEEQGIIKEKNASKNLGKKKK